jgi:hypothetical protein
MHFASAPLGRSNRYNHPAVVGRFTRRPLTRCAIAGILE